MEGTCEICGSQDHVGHSGERILCGGCRLRFGRAKTKREDKRLTFPQLMARERERARRFSR
jgi:hypothetical protein